MMPKRPERCSLDSEQVAILFPFHLLCSIDEIPRLVSAGATISQRLPDDFTGDSLFDHFEIKRPRLRRQSTTELLKHTNTFFVLECKNCNLALRGQFVANSDSTLLFLGSLLIAAADSLQVSGFTLKDFAPFDTAPEVLILHKFREMQLADLNKKKQELADTIRLRDRYNERANTDELTGIPNRRGFLERCTELIETSDVNRCTIILLLDLDKFKIINDSYGHAAGDLVLKTTGQRLLDVIDNRGIAGRLGGDEFSALVKLESDDRIEQFVSGLRHALQAPINFNRMPLQTGLSIGVASVEPRETIEQLLQKADVAMYAGRKKCRGEITWYSAELQDQINYRDQLEKTLEAAICNGDIKPHFQPIVSMQDFAVESFETLARWQHPELGNISPLDFIAVAEDLGLLQALDWLMLNSAMRQLQRWQQSGLHSSLHVNISGLTLTEDFPDKLCEILRQYAVSPDQLIVELTETSLLESTDGTIAILNRVADHGVGLQLDDFGTGYSALTHLLKFPVTGIKIDRSYIQAASESSRALALLLGLIELANSMGISTVAEGIEVESQLHMLRDSGCQYGQGYLFGRPAPANECLHTVKKLAA